MLTLVDAIIDSFNITSDPEDTAGIPLGNVTSQLFANIYLHELDLYIKHRLRQPYYLRYCDDFIILGNDVKVLERFILPIQQFLLQHLRLELHPKKVLIRSLSHGIDFLGYILFSHHCLLRISTKRRMKRRLQSSYNSFSQGELNATSMDQSLQSYLGMLTHANQFNLSQMLKNCFWVREPNFFE